jgi:hypothetical protein
MISVVVSENYTRDDVEELLRVLDESGAEVQFGGWYGRRSVDGLPPLINIVIEASIGALAGGLLRLLGTATVGAAKKVIASAARTRHQDQQPAIVVIIEAGGRSAMLRGFNPALDLDTQLDRALARLEELGEPLDLWYDEAEDGWSTLHETLARRLDSRGGQGLEA